MKIPYNNAVGKTIEDGAELVSDSNVDLYKWISPKPLTEDESNMPADSLATWAMHQANLGWSGNHGAFLHKIAITLKKQQAEIEQFDLARSIIKQQKLEIDALHNLVKEQEKKIIELAFDKVYAERTKELANNLEITDALNIADHLSRGQYDWCPEAEWVLRKQYDRIKELETNTLTDEEIEEVFQETIKQPNFMMLGDTQRFARAILRKAQE
jgi:hypothetical protein